MCRLKPLLPLFLCCLAGSSAAADQPGLKPSLQRALSEVDSLAAAEWYKDRRGSLTIGVVTDGRLAWTRSYGFADMEQRVPATRHTVYRIGSVTKEFTGLMLLQLAEAGKVRLADPVEKYFPEVNLVRGRFPNAPPITLIQLATMRAGLSREPEHFSRYLRGPVSDWEKILISALPHARYDFEPGTRFQYSNIGYAILGAALSRAARHSYVDYVQEHIFAPLKMKRSAFEPNGILPFLAKGYDLRKGQIDSRTPEHEHQGRGYKVPNGAIYSTIEDMARFVAFQLSDGQPGVLRKEGLSYLFRVASVNAASGYGLATQIDRHGDLLILGHSGVVAGYVADAIFDCQSHIGVIVLRNASGGPVKIQALSKGALQLLAAADRVPGP
jgi:CubicO group peptidase (beta-lactamase class C family)